MKSLRNKVILSAIVLGFALIATIGSTYAWFTVSNTVTIDSMQLSVTSADSLLIKVADRAFTEAQLRDVSNYKTTLLNSDIAVAGGSYANLLSWKLSPTTILNDTYDDIDAKQMNYLGALDSYTRPLIDAESYVNSSTGKFIEISFWVYSQANVTKDIVLSNLGISAANQDGTREDVVNAVRIAVWADDTTYSASTGNTGEAFIYGLDSDYAFAFVNNGLPGFYTGTPDTTNFNTLEEKGITTLGELNLAGTTSTMATVSSDVIFQIESNTPTLFTVRIYIEGWDASTTNDVVAAIFSINWQFGFAA